MDDAQGADVRVLASAQNSRQLSNLPEPLFLSFLGHTLLLLLGLLFSFGLLFLCFLVGLQACIRLSLCVLHAYGPEPFWTCTHSNVVVV